MSSEKPSNPPSYEEAVLSSSAQSAPNPAPPRPLAAASGAKNPNDLYTANLDLPWRYPLHHFCKSCKNTGYKTRNRQPCKKCWKQYAPSVYYGPGVPPYGTKYTPRPLSKPSASARPPTRPSAGPPPGVIPVPPGFSAVPVAPIPGSPPPTIVPPGHPSIGGSLCIKCRGKGLVSFFLDQETCPVCRGIGRVF